MHLLDTMFMWAFTTIILLAFVVAYFGVKNVLSQIRLNRAKLGRYRNHTVVLTGSTSGIGLSFAIELYRVGARLILVGRDEAKMLAMVEEYLIPMATNSNYTSPPTPCIVVGDLSLPETLPMCPKNPLFGTASQKATCNETGESATVVNIVDQIAKITTQIDAVICCAGLSMRDTVDNMSMYTEQYIMNVNYTSISSLCRSLIQKKMLSQGNIVVISSFQGLLSIPFRSSYTASKFALQAYFTSLRHELAIQKKNIQVTIVSPGYVQTNLSLNAKTGNSENYGKMDQNTADGMDPDDVAILSLKAALLKYNELWLCPPHHKLMVWLQYLAPSFTDAMLQKRGAKQYKEMTSPTGNEVDTKLVKNEKKTQ